MGVGLDREVGDGKGGGRGREDNGAKRGGGGGGEGEGGEGEGWGGGCEGGGGKVLTWPLPESSSMRSMRRRISGRGWWMVMMTVTPADARAARMSTTRDALLLSSPTNHKPQDTSHKHWKHEIKIAKMKYAKQGGKGTLTQLVKARLSQLLWCQKGQAVS